MSRTTEAIPAASAYHCRLCERAVSVPALSLGELPVCNRFSLQEQPLITIDFNVIECQNCRLIQLRDIPPAEELTPRLPWINYREPEDHLDSLVDAVLALRPNARSVLGTGPFEQPFLSRLASRGLKARGLGLDAPMTEGRYPYLESWPAGLNWQRLAAMTAELGTFDLVSCRYLIEHAPYPVRALRALKPLLNPRGLLLVEVPDSSKFLAARDYSFLWEEHSCYFVQDTLHRLAETAGFRVRKFLRYPGALEDALVAVLQVTYAHPTHLSPPGSSSAFATYRDLFGATRERLRARLACAAGPDRDGVALFGIGHHAIMFANAFGIADLIAYAVDDDPDKAGFFPPGFRVPVVGSQALFENARITTCLFAVAPHVQAKVQTRLAPLAARGVKFHSIYAALEDSIMRDLA